jgi:lipase chaperone LimK
MKWGITVIFSLAFMAVLIWKSSKPNVNAVSSVNSSKIEQPYTMSVAIDIDGHVPNTADNSDNEDVWQTEELRALLDFYVAYYEEGEQKMWQEFNQYCHPLTYCSELTELFERYLEYKTQLQNLDTERLDLASDFEDRLDELDMLRSELFSLLEISLLFDNEEVWDRHAIERLRINQNASLSKLQKAQQVKQQLEQLPDDMKRAVAPTQQLRKINQIVSSTALNSSHEYNQLAAEFGDDAAQRLVAVNQSQNTWLNKIQLFQQRNGDLKHQFGQNPTDYSQAITQLKQQMFEANEQKRLQVYLANPKLLKSAN